MSYKPVTFDELKRIFYNFHADESCISIESDSETIAITHKTIVTFRGIYQINVRHDGADISSEISIENLTTPNKCSKLFASLDDYLDKSLELDREWKTELVNAIKEYVKAGRKYYFLESVRKQEDIDLVERMFSCDDWIEYASTHMYEPEVQFQLINYKNNMNSLD